MIFRFTGIPLPISLLIITFYVHSVRSASSRCTRMAAFVRVPCACGWSLRGRRAHAAANAHERTPDDRSMWGIARRQRHNHAAVVIAAAVARDRSWAIARPTWRRAFAAAAATAARTTRTTSHSHPRDLYPTMSATPELKAVMEYVYARRPPNSTSSSSFLPPGFSAPPLKAKERKIEVRRIRSYMTITNAEKKPLAELFSNEPTRQLYVCNAGASCGVTYPECHALLSQYGTVTRLMMIGLSPFAIAEFETSDDGHTCMRVHARVRTARSRVRL